MPQLIKSIRIERMCAEGPPLGLTDQRKRKGPTYDFEQEVIDESANEQIVETNKNKRTQKKTIRTGRTYPFNRFITAKEGSPDFEPLDRSISKNLFGAFRSLIPEYLNSVERGRIISTSYIEFETKQVGKVEAEPAEDMFENNGWNAGTSWRYFEVLSELDGRLTVSNTLLKLDKLSAYVNKLDRIRIGPLHALRQEYGLVKFLEEKAMTQ